MHPKEHIKFGALFAFAVFLISADAGFMGALLVFLFSIIGDVDHYLVYIKKTGSWDLKKAYRYFSKMGTEIEDGKEVHTPLFIFHTIEFVFLLVFLSFGINFLFYIALGLLFHMFLDYLEVRRIHKMDSKFFSLIIYYLSKKKKN